MIQKSKYKFVLQKRNYDCGVAASATLLLNVGIKTVDYEKLSKILKSSKSGALSDHIVGYFRKQKRLKSRLKLNSTMEDLEAELTAGRICMVMYQGWAKHHEIENLEWGHYAVAVKVSKNKIFLLDPGAYKDWGDGIGWRIMDIADFKKRWIEKEKGKIIKGWMLSVSRYTKLTR